ncbi:AI-2E family transporter [Xanthobacter oligotrophicus]|uniref:AI-2E family transporter n=1 Tax=Xanthobacter oligotrophicus TaxID=2607286 RepID=UPI00165E886D|nr:AI-2E family transporter [Xanthobacter oligotrophicus]MCG5236485.1 AI-2E family transporter [Xanthobacter oligotrophicus]
MLGSGDSSFKMPVLGRGQDRLVTFFAAIAIVTVLYLGRDVFVPIAVAILLAFVLAPVIMVLRRIRIPRTAAVVAVVLVTFLGLMALGGMMALQVTDLVAELPQYRMNMRDKIKSLKDAAGGSGTFERTMDLFQDLSREIDAPQAGQGLAAGAADGRPVLVEVHEPPAGTLGTLSAVMAPLLHPLATFGIVFIFVLFILLQREDLRNRFVRLAGAHDLQRTTAALDDAGSRLSRFFLAQVALNASFGAVIGLGLWVIGVPSPFLWGLAAAVLRFVPYIGAAIAAALPIGLALAVDPGWSMVLSTAALFLVVEPVVGHVIEPLLYGRSTGLSPVAVIAAATFWTWLWGPVGLLLSTPLTLCLVVLGRHVESLEFLDVALGDQPPLSASELLYQRLLAGDPLEAAAAAEEHLKQNSFGDYADGVALPALRLAQRDAARGVLDEARQTRLKETLAELLDYLPDSDDLVGPPAEGTPHVLILSARSALDEAAALLFAHRLRQSGLRCETRSRGGLGRPVGEEVNLLVLSYLSPATPAHRRYTIRRLKRDAPGRRVIVADWGTEEGQTERLEGEDAVVTSIAAAVEAVEALPAPSASAVPAAAPAPLRAGAA